jgi:hypothetical protein
MSRKKSLRELDALNMVDDMPNTSTHAIDSVLFGAIQNIDANRQSASPISIFEIVPDPRQPRRTIPFVVRQGWSGRVEEIGDLFKRWVEMVNAERGGTPFDIEEYLDAARDIERPETIGPLEDALLTLIELAVSIRQDGLANPITVAPLGRRYQLETGERRWLSYHLLYLHTQDQKYSMIAARTVERVNIWRQAAENNARANLNAISKARQFAVLLMDLLETKRGDRFEPIDRFEREQDFYAQVADGERFTVPRNTSERLLTAMGLKNAKQLRDYRALLKLPPLVWQIADDLNWSEYFIRSLREQAEDDPAKLTALAVEQARQSGYSVPVGTLPNGTGKRKTAHSNASPGPLVPGTRQYYARMARLITQASPTRPEVSSEALAMVQEFRLWLDEQERVLRQYAAQS